MRPIAGEAGEGPASVVVAPPPGQMRVVRSSVMAASASSSPPVHARMNSRSRAIASSVVAALTDEAGAACAGSLDSAGVEKTLGCERKVVGVASSAAAPRDVGIAAVVSASLGSCPTGVLAPGSTVSCGSTAADAEAAPPDAWPAGVAPRDEPPPTPGLGRASRLVGLGACAREVVGSFVHAVPGVALDPFEGDAAPFHGAVDLLDELQVFDWLLVGLRPAALLPAEPPLGYDVDRVLRVGEDVQLFAGLGRGLKQTQNGG